MKKSNFITCVNIVICLQEGCHIFTYNITRTYLQLISIPSLFPDTTRVQKSYEMNGREYHYVSKETFENMVYSHR